MPKKVLLGFATATGGNYKGSYVEVYGPSTITSWSEIPSRLQAKLTSLPENTQLGTAKVGDLVTLNRTSVVFAEFVHGAKPTEVASTETPAKRKAVATVTATSEKKQRGAESHDSQRLTSNKRTSASGRVDAIYVSSDTDDDSDTELMYSKQTRMAITSAPLYFHTFTRFAKVVTGIWDIFIKRQTDLGVLKISRYDDNPCALRIKFNVGYTAKDTHQCFVKSYLTQEPRLKWRFMGYDILGKGEHMPGTGWLCAPDMDGMIKGVFRTIFGDEPFCGFLKSANKKTLLVVKGNKFIEDIARGEPASDDDYSAV